MTALPVSPDGGAVALVVQRLAALLPTLPGWSSVAVFDGPPIAGNDDSIYVTVGMSTASPPARRRRRRRAAGSSTTRSARSSANSSSIRAARMCRGPRAGFALYDALDASVKADRTLGGVLQGGATSALSYEVQYVSNGRAPPWPSIVTVSYQTTT
jgi:hypothetical protein